jgi:hypothetical protein
VYNKPMDQPFDLAENEGEMSLPPPIGPKDLLMCGDIKGKREKEGVIDLTEDV